MRVTVLGGGVSGSSMAALAVRLGADVFLSDAGQVDGGRLRDLGIAYEVGGHTERALDCDMVLVGSGFPPTAKILDLALKKGLPVQGELDFVLPYLRGRVIGITGSNGKTTTTSLIGHLLREAGARVAVAGNIGTAVADVAGEDFDYIVAELSSFQLHWASAARLAGAVVTNLAPDHIDWHGSYENYISAKARILSFVDGDGFSIVQERDAGVLQPRRPGAYFLGWDTAQREDRIVLDSRRRLATLADEELYRFDETALLGSHNLENVAMSMAVVALCDEDRAAARRRLSAYSPPPHRCALVLERGGIRYVDDSKGTNIAATIAALSSIEGSKIVILGGRGKGENYATLLEPLRRYAKKALLVGEAAAEIAEALIAGGYEAFAVSGSMERAVRDAAAVAVDGDVVLLSPACTSWDAYKNYGERGDHFASLVRRIVGGMDG